MFTFCLKDKLTIQTLFYNIMIFLFVLLSYNAYEENEFLNEPLFHQNTSQAEWRAAGGVISNAEVLQLRYTSDCHGERGEI